MSFELIIQGLVINLGNLGIVFSMFLISSVVPVPSEAALVAAGTIGFSPLEIAVFGGIGSALGAIVAYCIGKYGGRPFLDKYGKYFFINYFRLKTYDRWFKKWGNYTILFGRIIPIVPHKILSVSAGLAKIDLKYFFIFTLLGSIPRAFILSYFGYYLKELFLFLI